MTTPTIKFRGVRKDNGEYVYGSLIYYRYVECEIIAFSSQYSFGAIVHPDSVAQYTCMNDRNGKEIYGSIYLDGKLTKGGDVVTFGYDTEYTVRFEDGCFMLFYTKWKDIFGAYYRWGPMYTAERHQFNIEVLGSLFLNHELLK